MNKDFSIQFESTYFQKSLNTLILASSKNVYVFQALADKLSKEGAPGRLYTLKTDLRKEEDILAAFTWVERELGGADILTNNAGILIANYILGIFKFF